MRIDLDRSRYSSSNKTRLKVYAKKKMRLLKLEANGEFSLTDDIVGDVPPYAILSHTWGADIEEVTFKDLVEGTGKSKTGYAKIRFCGKQADNDGLKYFWVDTCCIDKSSSAELSMAINSMFRWYRNAEICYVYLSDVTKSDEQSAFRESRWFKRGWTLQELIAPKSVEFFSRNKGRIGDKESLKLQIHEITGIDIQALQGTPLSRFSFDERRLWMESRETKLEEDMAYALLGVLGIHMPVIYGEGREHAFIRLEEEFFKFSKNRYDKLPNVPQAAFNSRKNQHQECLKGTRIEVLHKIKAWAQEHNEKPIFWLNGLAGTGKSTIACTVAREHCDNGRLAASFFFSRGGGHLAHADKFFPTIAAQLARTVPNLHSHISASLQNHDNASGLTLRDQWNYLIEKPLSKLELGHHPSPMLIVIDALDECEGDDDICLLLKLLMEVRDITTIQLRVFITSRPETPIRLGFRQIPSILHHDLILDHEPRQQVDRDILTYFKQQFLEIRNTFEIVGPAWPGAERLSLLVEKSAGLFIYAATVCRFIKQNDQWGPDDLLGIFIPCDTAGKSRKRKRKTPKTSPFSELDKIYTQILDYSLKRIKNQDQAEIADEISEITSTIAILFQPLSLTTLGCILDIDHTTIHQRLKHLRSVFNVPDDESSPVRLLHPSFRDFLFDSRRCANRQFSVEEKVAHKRISEQCLKILSKSLKQDICGVNQSGIFVSDIERTRIQQVLPSHLEYACSYWMQHVLCSGIELRDDHGIHGFLRRHILHWLEALCWIGRLSDGIHVLTALGSRISVSSLYDKNLTYILTKNIRSMIVQVSLR